jgi:1-acyl-sn-glycerol-3-phosphate acyltransferase
MGLRVRSHVLATGFVAISAFVSITGYPFVASKKRQAVVRYLRVWEWALRVFFAICGVRIRYEGFDKKLRGVIVALNHESSIDIALGQQFAFEPAYWSRHELLNIPFFGSIARCAGMIPVNRAGTARDLVETMRLSRQSLERGQCVCIFPEGTRCSPDKPAPYHAGIYMLYKHHKGACPVVVAVHNSGDYIKKRGDHRRIPWFGTIRVVHAGVIDDPTLSQQEFMERLECMIRTGRGQLAPQPRLGIFGKWFTNRYLFPLQY